MSQFKKIADTIDSYREDMVAMQTALCSLPAISPSSGGEGEAKKAAYLTIVGFAGVILTFVGILIKSPQPLSPL